MIRDSNGTTTNETRGAMPECEDCEEMVTRRIRCAHCGLLVCAWCIHHVHEFAAMLRADAASRREQKAEQDA